MIAQINIHDLDVETLKWVFKNLPINVIILIFVLIIIYNLTHLIIKMRIENRNIIRLMEEARRPCEERIDKIMDYILEFRLAEAEN